VNRTGYTEVPPFDDGFISSDSAAATDFISVTAPAVLHRSTADR